jgi:large subunit ribosomal protein L18
MYAQVIDDTKGLTLVAASSMDVKGNKTEAAAKVGTELAKLAKAKGITKVVFDRGGFIYTGRVRALADAAREGGLEF